MNLRLIAGVVTALTALTAVGGGGFSRLYRLSSGTAWLCQIRGKIGNRFCAHGRKRADRQSAAGMGRDAIADQQVRRDTLRSGKFNREQQLKTAADDPTRQLLQQRLDEIDDALRDVNAERERLKNFSVS
jgi:hypothetical protein